MPRVKRSKTSTTTHVSVKRSKTLTLRGRVLAPAAQQARTRQRLEPRRPQVAFHALLGRFPPPLHPAAARCAPKASIGLPNIVNEEIEKQLKDIRASTTNAIRDLKNKYQLKEKAHPLSPKKVSDAKGEEVQDKHDDPRQREEVEDTDDDPASKSSKNN